MILPHDMLVLTVNGQNARLLRNIGSATDPRFDIVAERHGENPPDRELVADRPGRAFASGAPNRHAYQEASAHDRNEMMFALEALELLDLADEGSGPLVLIAPPPTLGTLRTKGPAKYRDRFTHEINKDLNAYRPEQIGAFLAGYEPRER